ncbi:MAG: UDP-3-O-(3-hydroxymyristoyl)glucosamine N-acyltransferase [bacterium]
MIMSVALLAEKLGGCLEGDGAAEIKGMAGLREAGPGDVSFLANPKYASALAATMASAVIVAESWSGTSPCALIRVKNPDSAFAKVADIYGPKPIQFKPGIHESAVVAGDAAIGTDVYVGPNCVVEPGARLGARTVLVANVYIGHGAVVGEDGRLYPSVTVREGVRIGNRVIVQNGAVIGSDGFGYVREAGGWKKIPQLGIVEIGDDVEIGANVTIDRARFGKTVIEKGVKLDNLIQIAHNVRIGENTAMAAQSGIAGSSTIGKNCMFAGQSGATGHVTVGDNCIIGTKAGVAADLPDKSYVMGFPAIPHGKFKRSHVALMQLPELRTTVLELKERVKQLEAEIERTRQC